MNDYNDNAVLFGNGDEPPSNTTNNPHINDLIGSLNRRQVLIGGATMSALAFLGAAVPGDATAAEPQTSDFPFKPRSRLPFEAIPTGRADTISVPPGYKATAFIPWGTPITGRYPAFAEDASNSAQDQAEQVGMHHDGMHFFPIDARRGPGMRSDHGLLVLNHEYIDAPLLHPNGPTVVDGKRTIADEVRKEINAHGVSVVEIRRNVRGEWEVVPSRRNRRITAATPMQISGPARGHNLLKTRYSPQGTATRGTQNNCSNGFTPWGTYLTCEENWAGYFATRDTDLPRELKRYGLRSSSRFGWETLAGDEFERFDATRKTADAKDDYRNEPNHFGWIVEIDPFDPDSTPVKHTALGRFAHEGLIFAPVKPGRPVVCYSGDDSQNEYIYKYVSRDKYRPGQANGRLLDDGTLYVARFNADGSGDWLPLDINDRNFLKACLAAGVTFADQGEVLINTRQAADAVGATRMDRPEWGAVNPDNGEVYFTLTNNTARTTADAANPRPANAFGHIIRWRENSRDHAGSRFDWNIFLLAGPETDSRGPNGKPLGAQNILASPDGLWFDDEGRLWIQTDMSGSQLSAGPFGNNQMLVADPRSGELKRFLVGPLGAEVTGISATPDFRTLFVNIQHPGEGSTATNLLSTWPDGPGKRPRSSTVIITREDGRRLL
ncbi:MULTISPECIES: PhoX family phosphatase [unclassified Pseudomonas]|uniref:PhoX family protein n=1 Tax=unclassified Pseudomonas TaxID=196821 RepID=UPI000EA979BC|nr:MULTISPECIES: PhoX family phosphatase [unclassified Pseudomonas]AYF86953.1 PhoX family phosphatase [Pseudomonas sp. DY-1]MDH4652369.1 PhoX family phosphatase [Pseudomonas sp. BN606]MRK24379.1 PhoX family phosphatase [Pseudomonas sp. JG-B]